MARSAQDFRGRQTISDSMKQLFLSEEFADATFLFGDDDIKVHAHRVILGMRSPVFKAMLYGPLSGGADSEIQIEDVDSEVFKTFLRFIYTDSIKLDGESVLKILYLANKYSLEVLEDKCCDFLKRSLTVENVFSIHAHAEMFSKYELQSKCFDFIIKHDTEVFETKDIMSISKEALSKILTSENLSAGELAVFKVSVRWAEHQCKEKGLSVSPQLTRQQLGDDFYHIRFPLIPMDLFAKEICKMGILLTEEEISLLRYMAIAPGDQKMVGKFISRPRGGNTYVLTFWSRLNSLTNLAKDNDNIKIKDTEIELLSPLYLKLKTVLCKGKVTKIHHMCSEGIDSYRNVKEWSHPKDICFHQSHTNRVSFNIWQIVEPGFLHKLVFYSEEPALVVRHKNKVCMDIQDRKLVAYFNTDLVEAIRFSL